jgi:hypothetical protein
MGGRSEGETQRKRKRMRKNLRERERARERKRKERNMVIGGIVSKNYPILSSLFPGPFFLVHVPDQWSILPDPCPEG